MLTWILRRFKFVQDLEWESQVRQRAFESAGRYVGQLEKLKESHEERIKSLEAENIDLRAENAALKEATGGHA